MSVLAEFLVPADQFVLADTLTAVPEVRIEIQRVVAGAEDVTPYFWAVGEKLNDFERALREDPSVKEILILEEDQEDERFFRVRWETRVPNLLSGVTDAKATILDAANTAEGTWELKLLFPDRDHLAGFHDYCVDHDLSCQLSRVYRAENPQEQGEYGVTEDQLEALEAAYRSGYFDVPRDTSLTELADELDISRTALSARLRRGERNLLSNTVIRDE